MKKIIHFLSVIALAGILLFSACSPVTMTSWSSPDIKQQVSSVFILTLFEKLQYMQPFQQTMAANFNGKGIKSLQSLNYMEPFKQYEMAVFQKMIDSLGVDAVLVFSYKGTDVSVNYSPPTYGGFYRGYYGGVYAASPGYWTETNTVNLRASLYEVKEDKLIWTGDFQITDPTDVNQVANQVANEIYTDWQKKIIVGPFTK